MSESHTNFLTSCVRSTFGSRTRMTIVAVIYRREKRGSDRGKNSIRFRRFWELGERYKSKTVSMWLALTPGTLRQINIMETERLGDFLSG
jgi:hypothetical protein